jgi:NTE family protein
MWRETTEAALVLQGGGALGAYEVGVAKRLYEQPGFAPAIISGVSIGAINAAALAQGGPDVIPNLEEMWEQFSVDSFPFVPESAQRWLPLMGNPNFFQLRYDYPRMTSWTSFYSTEPLRRILRERIDFDKINDRSNLKRPRLVMTATNILAGSIECFDNYETVITPDHVIASASLPPGFPMTCLEGKYYWDGGLFLNNPLGEAVARLRDCDTAQERLLIFVELFPTRGNVPQNLLDVFDRVTEIIFSSKLRFDRETVFRVNDLVNLFQAMDAHLPPDSPVRSEKGFERLAKYRKIDRILRIVNNEAEPFTAPLDFARDTIIRRVAAGYSDADTALKETEHVNEDV